MGTLTAPQRYWRSGYEPGSIAERFSNEQRRAWRAWMARKDADQRAFEFGYRMMGCVVPRRDVA